MYEQDTTPRGRPPTADDATLRGRVGEVAETAKQEAGHVADEVKHQAGRVASDLRGQLRHQAETRQQDLAERARTVAGELREMTDNRDPSPARTMVAQLAERSEMLADYLGKHGPDALLHDVQDFARRRPGAFLLSAAVAGFVVGRLTKGALQDRSSTSDSSASTYRSAAATREMTMPATEQPPAFGVAAAPGVEPTYAAGVASVPTSAVTEPVPPVAVPPETRPPAAPPRGGEPR